MQELAADTSCRWFLYAQNWQPTLRVGGFSKLRRGTVPPPRGEGVFKTLVFTMPREYRAKILTIIDWPKVVKIDLVEPVRIIF